MVDLEVKGFDHNTLLNWEVFQYELFTAYSIGRVGEQETSLGASISELAEADIYI